MPRKKDARKKTSQGAGGCNDFTIHDYANAQKMTKKISKAASIDVPDSWDQLYDVDFVEEVDTDENKSLVLSERKRNRSTGEPAIDERPGHDYPEILYYLISKFVRPEDVGKFAGINKTTYALSKRESFWRGLYARHCTRERALPPQLRIDSGYRLLGLRQRVVRALYHVYPPFVRKVAAGAQHDCQPRELVGRRCVDLWYSKGSDYCHYYLKLKSARARDAPAQRRPPHLLHLLDDIDANPEEHSRVLLVRCKQVCALPPAMGMLLCSASTQLAQGFRHHRLQLGFTRGRVVSPHLAPDLLFTLDTVKDMQVVSWWHPLYPPFDTTLPPAPADDDLRFLLDAGAASAW